MIFTMLTFLFSVFGFGVQACVALECGGVPPLSQSADVSAHSKNYEINDVPGNITLQIDGYEIAYPIRSEVDSGQLPVDGDPFVGANNHSPVPADRQQPTANRQPPTATPRYYILAEPILFRRAGDSEWKSFYTSTRPPSLTLPAMEEGRLEREELNQETNR